MTRRYYVPNLPKHPALFALPDEEARHAAKVMRVQAGDAVTLFDGLGWQADAVIESVQRNQVLVQSQSAEQVSRELSVDIDLYVPVPKGDRGKWLIEKCVELGVHQVHPIICERTQHGPSTTAIEKLRRLVVEASKQCERNQLMKISSPATFCEALDHVQTGPENDSPEDAGRERSTPLKVWLAHPGGNSLGAALTGELPRRIAIFFGPEGGFSDEELRRAEEQSLERIGLSPSILRIETAAIAVAAGILSRAYH